MIMMLKLQIRTTCSITQQCNRLKNEWTWNKVHIFWKFASCRKLYVGIVHSILRRKQWKWRKMASISLHLRIPYISYALCTSPKIKLALLHIIVGSCCSVVVVNRHHIIPSLIVWRARSLRGGHSFWQNIVEQQLHTASARYKCP